MTDKKWLLLEVEDGWQVVFPDEDIKPHANIIFDMGEEKEAIIADMNCPCCPMIDFTNKIIIHNAFDGRK